MITTDSVTIAVEVPIYLTPEDIVHMQQKLGFTIPLPGEATLTGYIDVLQSRNGAIHILDYKPKAVRGRPITYFEFYPLYVVYKRR